MNIDFKLGERLLMLARRHVLQQRQQQHDVFRSVLEILIIDKRPPSTLWLDPWLKWLKDQRKMAEIFNSGLDDCYGKI